MAYLEVGSVESKVDPCDQRRWSGRGGAERVVVKLIARLLDVFAEIVWSGLRLSERRVSREVVSPGTVFGDGRIAVAPGACCQVPGRGLQLCREVRYTF